MLVLKMYILKKMSALNEYCGTKFFWQLSALVFHCFFMNPATFCLCVTNDVLVLLKRDATLTPNLNSNLVFRLKTAWHYCFFYNNAVPKFI